MFDKKRHVLIVILISVGFIHCMLEVKIIFVECNVVEATSLTRSERIVSGNDRLTQREPFVLLDFFGLSRVLAGIARLETGLFTQIIVHIINFFKLVLMVILYFLVFLLFNQFVLIDEFKSPGQRLLLVLFFLLLALFGLH
jgi:hypothetical protein